MNPSPTSSSETRPAKPQTSVGQVFALVAGFLALAAIGATLGWTLTNTNGSNPLATSTTSAPVTSNVPSSAPPSPSPSPSPSGFTLPDYAALGTQFQDARASLLGMGIGVQLTFDPKGVSDGTVASTDPVAGKPVVKGQTVKIKVEEPAPLLAVPDVINMSCSDAGHQIAATGFTPNYPNGHSGTVTVELPSPNLPGDTLTAHWLDPIAITCGTATAPPPSPSASASPPSN